MRLHLLPVLVNMAAGHFRKRGLPENEALAAVSLFPLHALVLVLNKATDAVASGRWAPRPVG